MIKRYELKNNSIMKKKNQKELFFDKETIATINNASLLRVVGGNKSLSLSEIDTTDTSKFYSDGPPHTSFAPSNGPATTTLALSD